MIVCGIDEAGRGPVIGPMVLGCVLLDDKGRRELSRLDVRDSKKLSEKRRTALDPGIKEYAVEWSLVRITPGEIDSMRKKASLNAIEAMRIADIIASLENMPEKVIVDAPDTVAENFRERISRFLEKMDIVPPEIVSEHKADDRYIEVSAASVIAKVARDREIENLRREYGNIGSGYPSDKVTQEFMRNLTLNGEMPHYVRRSWNTVSRRAQSRLDEF
ncbi:MAG: ribonuclease HII [Candidatus Altiarchaeota archaeon]|nr:ribonuclease HII [Candidatus Altiarchaeota archaeon]